MAQEPKLPIPWDEVRRRMLGTENLKAVQDVTEMLWTAFRGILEASARRWLRGASREAQADAAVEVFLRQIHALQVGHPSLDKPGMTPIRWFRTGSIQYCQNEWRAIKALRANETERMIVEGLTMGGVKGDPQEAYLTEEEAAWLEAHIDRLSVQQAQILRLHLKEKTHAEIAVALGTTEANVKMQFGKAKQKIAAWGKAREESDE